MGSAVKLPVGVDDFVKIRKEGFYYVDKTRLIEYLLKNWGEVTLFTRPRRFGKTLNMSMLRAFLEIGTDRSLFDGLYIAGREELCERYMGRFPVIFVTLKGVEGLTFDSAVSRLTGVIAQEAERFGFLAQSERLTENERERYRALIAQKSGRYTMDGELLPSSLKTLTGLLNRHYGARAVVLIDEYDVPLDKAFQNGYYREMVSLMRAMLGDVLKTNEHLQFAVVTGCLRISKESIFTGLNNFKILSITNAQFDEQFGFTQEEVRQILDGYGLQSHETEMKEWYDGYHFGDVDVYCPWDVINHVDQLKADPKARPQAYWINTSGNGLVKRFIHKADQTTRDEIERLIAGETIAKRIRPELTYDELDANIDNLWSVLFVTGYLTRCGGSKDGVYQLRIPNREVREVFELQVREWFRERIMSNTAQLESFWEAFAKGDTAQIEQYLNRVLNSSISVFDTRGQAGEKESAYHTMLVGMLTGNADWAVRSNVEAGDGFADIMVKTEDPDAGIVAELKRTDRYDDLEAACSRALEQIRVRRYDQYLRNEDRNDILCYGIAFCRKKCRVRVERILNKNPLQQRGIEGYVK